VLAYQVMFSSEDPFYVAKNNSAVAVVSSSQLNSWQFALAVSLPVIVFLGLTLVLFVYWKRRQRIELLRQEQILSVYKERRRSESSRRRSSDQFSS
jgi:membrane protein implicated in regulation of membrane protease activity